MTFVPNQLHLSLAQRILLHARLSKLPVGYHFTETMLQKLLGTSSRGPVRAALTHLVNQGFVEKRPNKGFFLLILPENAVDQAANAPEAEDEQLYLSIAADRLAGHLEETVTAVELMRRYDTSRHTMNCVLGRIAAEGWIERRPGHGWAFVSMIDSIKAYLESYELRWILEPAGILAGTFGLDKKIILELRIEQEYLCLEGHMKLGRIELFESNAKFHEAIAIMSGNRFLAQTIARQNQLRRLVEYQQTLDRSRVKRQASEHLAIIECLSIGDNLEASKLMSLHLLGAKREKAGPRYLGPKPNQPP